MIKLDKAMHQTATSPRYRLFPRRLITQHDGTVLRSVGSSHPGDTAQPDQRPLGDQIARAYFRFIAATEAFVDLTSGAPFVRLESLGEIIPILTELLSADCAKHNRPISPRASVDIRKYNQGYVLPSS
jgi:hypothetical protein